MADWKKILSRGQVDDRRGVSPAAVGGFSVTGLALLLIVNYLSGGDIGDVVGQLNNLPTESSQVANSEEFKGQDKYEVFAASVLGSNNDLWKEKFKSFSSPYKEPQLVLFRTATSSSCGTATSQVGPHYCPLDQTIYLDETFFEELRNRFGAKGGDVAEAYVIAHEVGHHVQFSLGTTENIEQGDNAASIKLELQADCFAGLWASSIRDKGIFEQGEITEAIDAAAAVGDDRIQEKVTGQINPESWTHGSSSERVKWFNTGYDSGSFTSCDTFN